MKIPIPLVLSLLKLVRFYRILLSAHDHFPILSLAHYPVFNSCPRFLGCTRTELASRRVEHRSFSRVAVALPRVRHTHRLRRRMGINDAHGNIETVVCPRRNQSSRDKQLARRLPHNWALTWDNVGGTVPPRPRLHTVVRNRSQILCICRSHGRGRERLKIRRGVSGMTFSSSMHLHAVAIEVRK